MFKKISNLALLVALCLFAFACTTQQLQKFEDVLGSTGETGGVAALTNAEVIKGLKDALRVGIDSSVTKASAIGGFNKNPLLHIAFPEEAIKVKEKALEFGLDGPVERFESTLNEAAELASKEAGAIFWNAVQNMSIEDGFNILKGEENAATDFLRKNTEAQLRAKFAPTVQASIDKVKLTQYWEPLISKYNLATMLTGGEEINPDLNDYVTTKAIDGLFVHIASEEKNIRANPQARVTDILQKVFASVAK